MTEIELTIEDVNPSELLGVNNAYLKIIQSAYPKAKILSRGNELKLIGENHEIQDAAKKINQIIAYLQKKGVLTESKVADILNIPLTPELPHEDKAPDNNVLVHGPNGKIVTARTPNQRRMVDAMDENDILFATGPAGTGKTYTAVAIAVKALKNKEIKRIILARPAVEAGENLGFLPGDLKEKIDPYLRPLYDALEDMIDPIKLKTYLETRVIEIAPMAFMRGRTLDNAYVILDEAQNATGVQLKMFLTRMGTHAKFIITGDTTQIDLPKAQQSGLPFAIDKLAEIKGIQIVHLTIEDVVRHRLVREIIKAYGG
ncbi:MAG: PhoH family protein [Flavobacteriaceae bacterium]|nr:PhoH family protein [Flavobacteriaceae bacterium]